MKSNARVHPLEMDVLVKMCAFHVGWTRTVKFVRDFVPHRHVKIMSLRVRFLKILSLAAHIHHFASQKCLISWETFAQPNNVLSFV